jgi:hypothetical protein
MYINIYIYMFVCVCVCVCVCTPVALILPVIPFYTTVLRSPTDTIQCRTFMRHAMRVLDCIVTNLFGVCLVLWLF